MEPMETTRDEDDDECCSICLEPLAERATAVTVCNHRFHTWCLCSAAQQSSECPLCRTAFCKDARAEDKANEQFIDGVEFALLRVLTTRPSFPDDWRVTYVRETRPAAAAAAPNPNPPLQRTRIDLLPATGSRLVRRSTSPLMTMTATSRRPLTTPYVGATPPTSSVYRPRRGSMPRRHPERFGTVVMTPSHLAVVHYRNAMGAGEDADAAPGHAADDPRAEVDDPPEVDDPRAEDEA